LKPFAIYSTLGTFFLFGQVLHEAGAELGKGRNHMYMKNTIIRSRASQSHSICTSAETNVDTQDTHPVPHDLVDVTLLLDFDNTLFHAWILSKEVFTGFPFALSELT